MASQQNKTRVRTFPIKFALTFAAITGTLGGWAGISAESIQDTETTTAASSQVVATPTSVIAVDTLVAQVVPLTTPVPTATTEPTDEVVPTATTEPVIVQQSTRPMARTRSSR